MVQPENLGSGSFSGFSRLVVETIAIARANTDCIFIIVKRSGREQLFGEKVYG